MTEVSRLRMLNFLMEGSSFSIRDAGCHYIGTVCQCTAEQHLLSKYYSIST